MLAQVAMLAGEVSHHFTHGRTVQLYGISLAGILPQGSGNQDFGHISSSLSAFVWSGSGRKLAAWSNSPFLIERITNEYHGQEFSRSVFEKYASQSGCE